jgi:hypothetical protein
LIGIICRRKNDGPSTYQSTPDLHDSFLGSDLQSKGTKDFETFVKKSFYGLIQEEEKVLWGELSDLRVFCRVDVSIFQDTKGKYQYFINEVEASHGTTLFIEYIHQRGPRIMSDLASSIRAKVALRRARDAELAL